MVKIALLIGVSESQAGLASLPSSMRDIEALKQVLEASNIGGFHEVRSLLNPDLQTMQSEIELLFTEAERDDLVLLYFSGHGVKDETGKLYFTTSKTQKNSRNQLVKATMVPANFIHDLMNNCRAKRQGIILDCCFSGAFDPNLAVKDDSSIDLKGQLGAEGRVVLASSSHIQVSFGQMEDSKLSVYTSCLVSGLRTGEADLDKDGSISVRDLHTYVSSKVREVSPNMTPKLIIFKDLGFDIILAKSTSSAAKQAKVDFTGMRIPVTNNINWCDYLPNFLDPYETLIQDLILNLREISPRENRPIDDYAGTEEVILNIIRDSSGAKFILLFQSDHQGKLTVEAQSEFIGTADNQALLDILRSRFLPTISIESIFRKAHHGIFKECIIKEEGIHVFFVFIPINLTPRATFMVVAGLPEESKYLSDAYGKVISSFYCSSQSLSDCPDLVEAAIIDNLKKDYHLLTLALYNRRFDLFCKRLKQMTVYFEPILELDSLTISGWEALARDPGTSTAPYDLFHAAELWGAKFMLELDQYFLRVAAEKYREGRREIKQNRRQDILPLSVNVYPESLTKADYFDTVRQIVKKERLIPGKKLILEICEKVSLPKYDNDLASREPWASFRNELEKYVVELQVRFAIDDFGVRHASVSQLAGLKPPYIKVDREILFHESRDIIINFVHDLGAYKNTLNPPEVILEGFDEESPVALGHLKEIGVNYIQGYIVNRAQPQIYRLPEEKIKKLKNLLGNN